MAYGQTEGRLSTVESRIEPNYAQFRLLRCMGCAVCCPNMRRKIFDLYLVFLFSGRRSLLFGQTKGRRYFLAGKKLLSDHM